MPRIVVVEDQRLLAQVMSHLLTEQGYTVQHYADGLDGYLGVLREPPDLLVLDVLLPTLQGLALSRLLKFSEEWCHIPILVVSSVSDDIDDTLRAVKADSFLAKPFEPEVFLERVARLLAQAESASSSVRPAKTQPPPESRPPAETLGPSVDLMSAAKATPAHENGEHPGEDLSHAMRGGEGMARVRYLRAKPH